LTILFQDFLEERATQLWVASEFLGIAPVLFTDYESVHGNTTVGGSKKSLTNGVTNTKKFCIAVKKQMA